MDSKSKIRFERLTEAQRDHVIMAKRSIIAQAISTGEKPARVEVEIPISEAGWFSAKTEQEADDRPNGIAVYVLVSLENDQYDYRLESVE